MRKHGPRQREAPLPESGRTADEILPEPRLRLVQPQRCRLAGRQAEPRRGQALLVDTTGELGRWWGTAAIAFVGGSLDGKRGGQNMLEPAAYGAAVAFGPHTRNFRDEVARLLAADAAEVVADGAGLTAFVARCLDDPAWAAGIGDNAARLVASQRGAVAATARMILAALSAPGRSGPQSR